jgi:hypothetical protein
MKPKLVTPKNVALTVRYQIGWIGATALPTVVVEKERERVQSNKSPTLAGRLALLYKRFKFVTLSPVIQVVKGLHVAAITIARELTLAWTVVACESVKLMIAAKMPIALQATIVDLQVIVSRSRPRLRLRLRLRPRLRTTGLRHLRLRTTGLRHLHLRLGYLWTLKSQSKGVENGNAFLKGAQIVLEST